MFNSYAISAHFKRMKFSKSEFKSVAQATTAVFQQAFIYTNMCMFMYKWKISTDVNTITHTATYIPGSLDIHYIILNSYLTAWSFTTPQI